jgi:predicted 2-oxoglutarate/Fe(II)-dependent dioxygenase YbiX
MTLNLNAGEYEGGYLTFPEYDLHLYKPDTGSAVIFSCSLMHEATPVRSGRRFGLFAFFYGEKEEEARDAYERRVKNDYSQVIKMDN